MKPAVCVFDADVEGTAIHRNVAKCQLEGRIIAGEFNLRNERVLGFKACSIYVLRMYVCMYIYRVRENKMNYMFKFRRN